jgi:hypothetical protein
VRRTTGNRHVERQSCGLVSDFMKKSGSVVGELVGRRNLNQRVVGSNPGEGTARYREQDTLKSTAQDSQNKQNCFRHVYP